MTSIDLDGQDYADVSERIRLHSALRLAALIENLEPFARDCFDGKPAALSYMEPARISAQVSVLKVYVSAVEKLGQLYRVTQVPVVPEPVEPMIPAAQVPLMIEAAVDQAVTAAVADVEARIAQEREARAQVSAQEAREALVSALGRIRGRSS